MEYSRSIISKGYIDNIEDKGPHRFFVKLFLGVFFYTLLHFIVNPLNPGMMKREARMLNKNKLHIIITKSGFFFKLENTSKKMVSLSYNDVYGIYSSPLALL